MPVPCYLLLRGDFGCREASGQAPTIRRKCCEHVAYAVACNLGAKMAKGRWHEIRVYGLAGVQGPRRQNPRVASPLFYHE